MMTSAFYSSIHPLVLPGRAREIVWPIAPEPWRVYQDPVWTGCRVLRAIGALANAIALLPKLMRPAQSLEANKKDTETRAIPVR